MLFGIIRSMKLIGLFVVMCCVGVAGVYVYTKFNLQTLPRIALTPSPISHFSLQKAPTASLPGNILSLSGGVSWQSRVATESVHITSPQPVQQGESVTTDATGSAVIEITKEASLALGKNTTIDLIQTLPVNIVVHQDGSVMYTVSGTYPFSVRGLGLLLTLSSQSTVTITTTATKVTAAVTKGQLTAAYTDTDDVSTVLMVTAGQLLKYDDPSRTTLVN